MPDWKERLTQQLEPLLKQPDPRQQISAYHDMPYAIFRYPPEEEFAVRQQVSLLRTRLEQIGKRVTAISLAECLHEALEAEDMGPEALVDAEKSVGLEATVDTIFQILSEYQPSLSKFAISAGFCVSGLRMLSNIKKILELTGNTRLKSRCIKASVSPCHPMLQHSKIVRSRDDWKRKAVERAEKVREHKKTEKRHRQQIAQMKVCISTLEQAIGEKKRTQSPGSQECC